MNQWQFDTIVATLQTAVPTLAPNLIQALSTAVEEWQKNKSAEDAENAETTEKEDN